ncbi:putative MFS monocarboxylate transporter [Amylocystis lapponica]|nr:putative MFS monocarboxylate transporter [Amylocystis lapponica]
MALAVVQSSHKRKIIDLDAWRYLPCTLFTASLLLSFVGLYIPFFYITSYARLKTGADSQLSFYFLAIINAASAFGRTLPSLFADKVGPVNMLIPCIAATAILAFCWIPVHDVGGLTAFAVLYGFFSGSFVSLPPSVISILCPDMSLVGTRMGMTFTFGALGLLIGNPIAGALLDLQTGEFVQAQIFCGVTVFGALALCTGCRYTKVGFTLRVKT